MIILVEMSRICTFSNLRTQEYMLYNQHTSTFLLQHKSNKLLLILNAVFYKIELCQVEGMCVLLIFLTGSVITILFTVSEFDFLVYLYFHSNDCHS